MKMPGHRLNRAGLCNSESLYICQDPNLKTTLSTASIKDMKVSERQLVVTLTAPKRLLELQETLRTQLEESEHCPDFEMRTRCYDTAEDDLVMWATDARTRRADHLVSSVVIFIAEKPTELQRAYLSWIDECGGSLAKEQSKPVAFVALTKDSLTKDLFVTEFLRSQAGGKHSRKEFEEYAFEHLDVLHQDAQKGFPGFSVSSIKDLTATLTHAKNFRQTHGFFWSRHETLRIQEKFERHQRDHTPGRFSLAFTLGESHPGLAVDGDVHFALLKNDDDCVILDRESRNKIISSYLILHTRRVYPRSYIWLGCTTIKREGTRSHFAEQYFNFHYRDPLRTLLRKTDDSYPKSVKSVLEMWMDDMADDGGDKENPSSLAKHLATLQSHATVLKDRKFGGACFACLCRNWSALLPCGCHGLCNDCLMALDPSWSTYGGALVTACDICGQHFKDWRGRVTPPDFTPSVLSLDGGGVRGLIQLEVLRLLQEEIAVDIPLCRFFDLIVGTSIGKHCSPLVSRLLHTHA